MQYTEIDGSYGEGGGQILRTSMALAMITNTPIAIHSIRGKRKSPGLKNQHLTSVRAAAAISNGTLTGDYLESSKITFTPGTISGGSYSFDTGTAGSCFLVFQTIFPALLGAKMESSITITGGTHNLMAPPAEFIDRSFLGTLRRMGINSSFKINRYGFYPQGGGAIEINVTPGKAAYLDLTSPEPITSILAEVISIKKPLNIPQEQIAEVRKILPEAAIELVQPSAVGPGNAVAITVIRNAIEQVFTGFGKRDVPPTITARVVAQKAREYCESGILVDSHLTDQLMIPLVLGNGGRFICAKPTLHATTNAEIIRRFTGAEIKFEQISPVQWLCTVPSL